MITYRFAFSSSSVNTISLLLYTYKTHSDRYVLMYLFLMIQLIVLLHRLHVLAFINIYICISSDKSNEITPHARIYSNNFSMQLISIKFRRQFDCHYQYKCLEIFDMDFHQIKIENASGFSSIS